MPDITAIKSEFESEPHPASTTKIEPAQQQEKEQPESKEPQEINPLMSLANLLTSVLPSQFRFQSQSQHDKPPKETTATTTTLLKTITTQTFNTLKSTFLAHPYVTTFILSQILLSGLPIALFLIGLAITTTIAASVFAFFAFLVLGPVLAVTGFLGLCLWGWGWVAWRVSRVLWGWYSLDGDDDGDGGSQDSGGVLRSSFSVAKGDDAGDMVERENK